MTQTLERPSGLSRGLTGASILAYILWLMLPMVQTTGRALTGVIACGLFALGAALDSAYLKRRWLSLALRALCAAATPVLMWFFLRRGGSNFWGFYAQHAMFWFPLIYCAYARERADARTLSLVKWTLLGAMALTTATTIGWLVQGMLRGGRVYAYSRSLGYAGEGREAYLKELMLRNIGGYDFIYATVVALPFTMLGIGRARGWKRGGLMALLFLQVVMIVLSQYTYAMVFAACTLAVELIALIVRAASRGRVKMGASLLCGLVPLVLVALLREPIVSFAAGLCERVGFTRFSFSLNQLLVAMQGGVTSDTARLAYYLLPLHGIAESPLVGAIFGGEKLLSQHSDVLDLPSGMGVIGAAAVGGMIWLMGRGCMKGLYHSGARAQIVVSAVLLGAIALTGTVVYSRDIMVVFAVGSMLALEGDKAPAQ